LNAGGAGRITEANIIARVECDSGVLINIGVSASATLIAALNRVCFSIALPRSGEIECIPVTALTSVNEEFHLARITQVPTAVTIQGESKCSPAVECEQR